LANAIYIEQNRWRVGCVKRGVERTPLAEGEQYASPVRIAGPNEPLGVSLLAVGELQGTAGEQGLLSCSSPSASESSPGTVLHPAILAGLTCCSPLASSSSAWPFEVSFVRNGSRLEPAAQPCPYFRQKSRWNRSHFRWASCSPTGTACPSSHTSYFARSPSGTRIAAWYPTC